MQNGNVPSGLIGHNPNQQPNSPVPQPGVMSFEQARQQQQPQRDDNWARPPPPSDRRALTPITERSARDSNSWDHNVIPGPLHRPGLSIVNGSPPQPDQIQEQRSETSQDLPKLQTDAESSTFLGETIVTSPTSHTALHDFGIGRVDPTVPFGLKPDHHQSREEPVTISRPDSKLDTHPSTDPTHPTGDLPGSPLGSPGREPVFPTLPSSHSHQPIHPVQPTFSDIPKTPPRSPERPTFTPPIRRGPGAEYGSQTQGSSSRLQGVIQRNEGSNPSNSLTVVTAKTLEPSSLPQAGPHANSPAFSPTPTTTNSLHTLAHTNTTTGTSKSEYSGYSDGSKPSTPQHVRGTFPSPDHLNQDPSQSRRAVQVESLQKNTLPASFSGNVEGVKPLSQVNGMKEGSEDDLTKEAGALYYIQEIQGAEILQPPRIVGRGQNTPMSSRGQLGSGDDENKREPATQVLSRPLPQQIQVQSQPRNSLPPEPSPLQLRRPSAQATASFPPPQSHHPPPPSPPQPQTQPSPHSSQGPYQDHTYAQSREQQPILAPQPQQPVTSSFNPVKTMEGDARSPNLQHRGSETSDTSPATDSRRASVIGFGSGGGQGGGGRPGLTSRPSGARDPVLKQRAGTCDSISSQSRHNSQPQPRHPLPPHPESAPEQPSQPSYSAYTQFSHHQGQIPTQSPGDTTRAPQAIHTADRYPVNMANTDQHHHYDDNADALAALTFLERDEGNAISKPPPPPPLQGRVGPTPGSKVQAYEAPPVHVTPPESRDDISQDSGSYEGKYKSSFAPSKQATQRLAKTQAQQAAHQAAVHRPGKSGGANGKGKRRVRQEGWAESSDEEDEEDDEEDDDVDSDGDPVGQRRSLGPGKNLGKLSAQGSPYGSSTDLNQPGQGKSPRNLPRPPSGYGVSLHLTFFFAIPFRAHIFPCRRSRRLLPSTGAWRIWSFYPSSTSWKLFSKPVPRRP